MSATSTPPPANSPLTISIYINESELSQEALTNLEQSLNYAKVDYRRIEKEALSKLEPSPYHILALSGEHTKDWPLQDIQSFVQKGGRLLIAGRFIDPKWQPLIGVTDFSDFIDDIYGLQFERELFPGYPNLEETTSLFSHSIADVELSEESDVYITAMDEPIFWTHNYGDGKVAFWNTTSITEKSARGILLQSLSLLPPSFVSNQVGAKVMYIDDFPSPIPYRTPVMIREEYDMNMKQFYTSIWWEDMKRMAHEHDATYTGVLIGTYEQEANLSSEELNKRIRYPMLYFGRDLLKEGGELGLHGYNHQSLVTKSERIDPKFGYKPWEDQSKMEEAIKRVSETFHYYFPNEQIRTYVPPSNVLNETGMAALSDSLTDLQIVAALYSGTKENGSYIQEFGYDETYPSIYHFPRISSGYVIDREEQYIQADAVANFGVASHFIHPDDVLDPRRSYGEGWEDMEEGFEEMLSNLKETYPHLEALTQYRAFQKLITYQQSTISISYEQDSIQISGNRMLSPSTLLVRVNEGNSLATGTFDFGVVEPFGQSNDLYRVTLTEPNAQLKIKDVRR